MPLKEETVETLLGFFKLTDPKERFDYGIKKAVTRDPSEEGQGEIVNSMAVAAAITTPKHSVIHALIDQAISSRFNAEGLSEDEREKISFMLAAIFMSPDEDFKDLAKKVNPFIVEVHDVYEMHKSVEGLLGEANGS